MLSGSPSRQRYRLDQCLECIVDNRGKTPPLSDKGIELIEVNAFVEGQKSPNFARIRKYVSEDTYATWFRNGHPKSGDTLITTVGAIGQVAFVSKERGCIAQNVVAIRPRTDIVDPAFLFYYLSSTDIQKRLNSLNIGVAQPSLKVPHLLELDIELLPLAIQRRIASILSAYDDLIENNQRRIKILEEMARSLYREWFVHFRFPGHEKVKMIPSPLGLIPQGWEVKKLAEIAEDMRRNVPKGKLDEARPYVGLEHIPRRSLALDDWEMATDLGSNKLEFKKGEVLFGKIRPYFHKVSVAPFDGVCSADTIVIRARRPEQYAFVVACVSSDAFVAQASATANGAKMPRANWDVLQEYKVVIPAGQVAEQFSTLFTDIITQQQTLIFQIQNLCRTRDLLLPRLLSGNLSLN
jgi:type I restriction enzyme S subunit